MPTRRSGIAFYTCSSLLSASIAGSALADVQFFAPEQFELSGSEPRRIAAANLDGDASLDLIVTMSADGEMAFLFGQPDGSFPDGDSLQTNIAAWGLGVADFNGDGLDDFAVTDGAGSSSTVKVYLNDGGGGFNAGPVLSAGAFPLAVAAADFDGDADIDLAVANNTTHGCSIFTNDGDGSAFTFQGHVPGLASYNATDIDAGDLDGDGDLDLVLAHYNGVAVCTNDGAGAFTHVGSAGYGSGTTHAVALGDVDNDGLLDVASCQIYSGTIAVRLGNGDATFDASTILDIGSDAHDVILADITGEGRDDVVAVNQSSGSVHIFESVGGGSFVPAVSYSVGVQPAVVAAADFDSDGDPDLALPCRNLGETPYASVLLNDQQPPLCVDVLTAPEPSIAYWAGHVAGLEVTAVGEPPLSYQWMKDGQPLADGPSASGSQVSGSDTNALVITGLTPTDAGDYAVEVTAPCGSIVAGPFTMSINSPPDLPTSWSVVNLHPGGSLASSANAIDELGQYGSRTVFFPDAGINVSHPGMWTGSAASFVDFTPASSAGGSIVDAAGGRQVGWWWWPYPCQQQTCYTRQAAQWTGSLASFDNLQVSGWEYSSASATDGTIVVGTKSDDDASGNTYAHAVIWSPPNYWSIDLHPGSIVSKSFGSAIDGDHQYGAVNTPFPAPYSKAAKWTGSADSYEDLHPAGASRSWISHAGDGQQSGSAEIGGSLVTGLWAGSRLAFMPMQPSSGASVSINDVASGLQAGSSNGHATLWATDPDLSVDLHPALPGNFGSSVANAIWIDGSGVIHVVGSGYNTATERTEALLWIAQPSVPCPADLDGSGAVNADDLFTLLGSWGPCAGCPADLTGDDAVNADDLFALLGSWGPC